MIPVVCEVQPSIDFILEEAIFRASATLLCPSAAPGDIVEKGRYLVCVVHRRSPAQRPSRLKTIKARAGHPTTRQRDWKGRRLPPEGPRSVEFEGPIYRIPALVKAWQAAGAIARRFPIGQ